MKTDVVDGKFLPVYLDCWHMDPKFGGLPMSVLYVVDDHGDDDGGGAADGGDRGDGSGDGGTPVSPSPPAALRRLARGIKAVCSCCGS